MTLLSEKGESNKTYAKKISYEALYEAPLTRKTRLYCPNNIFLRAQVRYSYSFNKPIQAYGFQVQNTFFGWYGVAAF